MNTVKIIITGLLLFCCTVNRLPNKDNDGDKNDNIQTDNENPKLESGIRTGNGGDVVVCKDKEIRLGGRKVATLDLMIAMDKKKPVVSLPINLSEYEMAAHFLEPLKSVDFHRFNMYTDWLNSFPNESFHSPSLHVPDIPDEGSFDLPSDCTLEQGVVHQPPVGTEIIRYYIQGDIWSQMDPFNKAVMILHEIVYREAFDRGHDNPRYIRELVGDIISGQIPDNKVEYRIYMQETINLPAVMEYSSFPIDAMTLSTAGMKIHINGKPEWAEVDTSDPVIIFGAELDEYDNDPLSAEFFDSGNIKALVGDPFRLMKLYDDCPQENQSHHIYAKKINFNQEGHITEITKGVSAPSIPVCYTGKHLENRSQFSTLQPKEEFVGYDPDAKPKFEVLSFFPYGVWKGGPIDYSAVFLVDGTTIKIEGEVELHQNGEFKKAILAAEQELQLLTGSTLEAVTFSRGTVIELNEDGVITSATPP